MVEICQYLWCFNLKSLLVYSYIVYQASHLVTLQLHNSQQENGSFAMIWSKLDGKKTYRTISVFTQIEEIAMSDSILVF